MLPRLNAAQRHTISMNSRQRKKQIKVPSSADVKRVKFVFHGVLRYHIFPAFSSSRTRRDNKKCNQQLGPVVARGEQEIGDFLLGLVLIHGDIHASHHFKLASR